MKTIMENLNQSFNPFDARALLQAHYRSDARQL